MRLTLACACAVLAACASQSANPAVAEPPRVQVAVVGGGIGGLVAAYELEKLGLTVHVLEKADQLGGRIGTAHFPGGATAEYGMQEIWAGSPLAGIAQGLGLQLDQGGPFSSVLLDRKLQPFTQDTADQYFDALFTPSERAAQRAWLLRSDALLRRLESSGLAGADLKHLQDISFTEWLTEERLPERVKEWALLTMECEIGADGTLFSALSGLAELRVFLRAEDALHVRGGNSRLVDSLARAIRGPKTVSARVTRIERRATGATVTYQRGDRIEHLHADWVVLAVPWWHLSRIQLDPPLPAPAQEAIDSLQRSHYTVVHFAVRRGVDSLWKGEPVFPVLTRGPLGVIYGPGEAPAQSPTEVFSLLIYGAEAQQFHGSPQEPLRRGLLTELDSLWPGFSSYIEDTVIYTYHPGAVTSWPAGRSPYDEQAQRLFLPMDRLSLVGDWLVSSHSEGAVVSARRQAAQIAALLR